jgi:hypothetical protein
MPRLLRRACRTYLHREAEAPFGYILQWRLYLFAASRNSIAKHHARWDEDVEGLLFQGTHIRLDQLSQLIASEQQRARQLLEGELLLGAAKSLPPMQAWRLHDDLDADEVDGSWLTEPRNAELLAGAGLALLRQVQASPQLRQTFLQSQQQQQPQQQGQGLGPSQPLAMLCPKAMQIYEGYVQEFLGALLVACQVQAGPPIRSPELLSITTRNTSQPRHLFLWSKQVLLHTRYHKSQEVTGSHKEIIRSLTRLRGICC